MEHLRLERVPHRDLDDSPNLLQTGFWGEVKAKQGWTPLSFKVKAGDEVLPLLVLLKELAAGYVLAYVPHGPQGLYFAGSDGLEDKLAALVKLLKPHLPGNTLFVRFDLLSGTTHKLDFSRDNDEDGADGSGGEAFPRPLDRPLRKPVMDIQPPDTVILDLTQSLDQVLAGMKKKTRYNLKLAEKKGVEIVEGSQDDLADWYRLYQETSTRDKIALHSFEYYKSIFDLAFTYGSGAPTVKLLLARYQGQLLAGNVVVIHGKQGFYLYGASSNEHRNLMATYALQGRGIEICQAAGCETYDFFGIPPRDDPSHPMHGLYRFKVGFGGTIVHRHGAWDYPLKPMMYSLFRAAEGLRFWFYKKLRKGK